MSQSRQSPPRMTLEEFAAWTLHQETKHEFVDGVPVEMAGAKMAHCIIQANLAAAAAPKLRGGPCRALSAGMLLKTGTGRGRYPDMTIDGGPRNPADLVAPNPVVVFEVLSPDTQKEDRTRKLADYNATHAIAHYVLIEPSEPLVHVYNRGPHGDFLLRPEEIRGRDESVELPAVGLALTMDEIYDGLDVGVSPAGAAAL